MPVCSGLGVCTLAMSHEPKRRILRRKQVEERTGLSRSTIYQRIEDGRFPRQIALGSGKHAPVGWIESEVDDWIEEHIKRSRETAN